MVSAGKTLVIAATLSAMAPAAVAATLSEDFRSPPAAARPQTWYHLMNGNVTEAGITKDFEALAEQGVGGVHMIDAGLDMPRGPVAFASVEWFAMMRHAAKEARRLGLEIVVPTCSGWSSSGGPWITPERSMKKVVWSEARVSGGGRRQIRLPADDLGSGFYEDIALLAFPTPRRERQAEYEFRTEIRTNVYTFAAESPVAVNGLEYRFSFSFGWHVRGSFVAEASDDGVEWREIAKRQLVLAYSDGKDFSTRYQAFDATVTAKCYRVKLEIPDWGDASFRVEELRPVARLGVSEANFKSLAIRTDWERRDVNGDAEGTVAAAAVRRLDVKLAADGTGEWEAPEGEWTVIRIGYASNGKKNHPATETGVGLEVDKLDGEAVAFQFEQYVGRLCRELGAGLYGRDAGGALTGILIDSYETGAQNWTKRMPEEFRRRAGYEITPYLPALAGHVVESATRTDAFLADFRRVVGELFATQYAGTMARKAHEYDLDFWLEPYGNIPGNGLEYGRHADIPMAEFWSHGQRQCAEFGSTRYASHLAHVWGRRQVAAEAFTGAPLEGGRWQTTPYSIKRQCDTAYAEGLNKVVYHRFTHQPWTEGEYLPGMTMGMWGMHFDRTQTWWPLVGEFIRYQSRCQALLQRGTAVADVLFFAGEGYPNNAGYDPGDGTGDRYALAAGWKFDICDAEALQALRVAEGRVVVPGGTEYAVLVLPEGEIRSAALAAAVARLREEGAEIAIGERPEAALKRLMVAKDADIAFRGARFAHRREGGDDWYFVAVPNNAETTVEASFRIGGGRVPELWDAETGERYRSQSWRRESGRVFVDIPMRPNGSMFVVFPERPTEGVGTASGREGAYAAVRNLPPGTAIRESVLEFPGIAKIRLGDFTDWTRLDDFDLSHFSGTATYAFEVPAAGELDLGEVKHFAEVFDAEGRKLATMWRPPFRCEVPAGKVTVKVTNLWPNRLIGDDFLEPNCEWENWQVKAIPEWVTKGGRSPTARKTFTTRRHWTKDDPLLPSGILGPVKVRTAE